MPLPERLHAQPWCGVSAKKLPVLVWIHGGGLFDGESNDYDATALVKGGPAGPTVVVTINYRLGLLGYFAHPAIDAEGHHFGNYGLMDQQAALHWVKRNIAAFGGDPGNVTVGGQSAGSTSTAALVISPASAGLFHRAIFESGPLLTVAPLRACGVARRELCHCRRLRRRCDRRGGHMSARADGPEDPVAARHCRRERSLREWPDGGRHGPADPGDTAWSTGKFNHMPIMNGSVADEGAFAASINELFFGPMSAERYANLVKTTYGGPPGPGAGPPNYPAGTPDAVLAKYPLSAYTNPERGLGRGRHGRKRMPASLPQQPCVPVCAAVRL